MLLPFNHLHGFFAKRVPGRRRWLLAVGLLVGTCLQPSGAQSNAETITIVVPYAQNGPTDRTLRAMVKPLSQALGGIPIEVKNLASPGGVKGLEEVVKAKPNGRTLLFTNTNVALLPALGEQLSFDPLRDLSYLGLVLEAPMVVLSKPDLKLSSAQDLAQWMIRTEANVIRLADAGAGSASYLCGLFLQSLARKTFTRVEFPGSAPAMTALKDNKVDVLCDQTPSVKAPLVNQQVNAYAVTTDKPLEIAPFSDLTTLRRMFSRELELSIWHGFYGPKGLAPEVIARLNSAIARAAADPAFVASQEAQGVVMVHGRRLTPEGHHDYVQGTIPLWTVIASVSKLQRK